MTMCCIFMSDISTKVSFFFIKKNKYRHRRHNSVVKANDFHSFFFLVKAAVLVTFAVINLFLTT